MFGKAADSDLTVVRSSSIDIYNQTTVDIRLLLAAAGPGYYQLLDISGIGDVGPVNISSVVSLIRPDDDVAGDCRVVLTSGIIAYSKDFDVMYIRNIGAVNIAFGFVYDNVPGNIYDVVEIFAVASFVRVGIASAYMFGYSEINRPGGDIGTAYTVGRIPPFAFYVLVYAEMFQPDYFIA